MSWIDWIVVAAIAFGLLQGFRHGFIAQLAQLLSMFAAMAVAFSTYTLLGGWMERQLQVPITFANPIALMVLFFALSFAFQTVATLLQKLLAPVLQASIINRAAGTALGGLRQTLTVSIILALLVTLPVPGEVKAAVDEAKLGKPLVRMALSLERLLSQWIDDDSLKSLSYRTIGADDTETTALNYTVQDPKEDPESEVKLFALTNATRQKEDKSLLIPNEKLREVARNHARDMLAKGYFSHIAPDGKDGLQRVQEAGVIVVSVGENLANAPTVEIAHVGLMASEGHRRNILSEDFNAVGIGVLDAGTHGKMVVEIFGKTF